jgi:hypothetical protein
MRFEKEINEIIERALRQASEDLEDANKMGDLDEDTYINDRTKLDTFGDEERKNLAKRINDDIELSIIETLEKD